MENKNLRSFDASTAMVAILPKFPINDSAHVVKAKLPVDFSL